MKTKLEKERELMKIVIYSGYGSCYVPPVMRKEIENEDFIHGRIKLASILEDLEPTHEELIQTIYDEFVSENPKDKETLHYLKCSKDPSIVYVKNLEDVYGFTYKMEVVDVDTSRIWKIIEYDGAEGIEYFSEPRIIDKDLNFGEW